MKNKTAISILKGEVVRTKALSTLEAYRLSREARAAGDGPEGGEGVALAAGSGSSTL